MNLRRLGKISVAIIAVGCFAYLGRNYFGDLDRLTEAHWWGVIGIAAIHLVTLWVQGLTIKLGMHAYGHNISPVEGFRLIVIGSYANLLIPRSGIGTTAVYLKRIHKSSVVDFSSIVLMGAALLVFAVSSVGCLVAALDWWVQGNPAPAWLWTVFVVSTLGSGFAIFLRLRLPESYGGPGKSLIHRWNHAVDQLARSGQIRHIGAAHFALVLLRAARLFVAFKALSMDVSFQAVLMTSILGDLAFVIAVTPGALGFREAAIALAASRLGIDVPAALGVAVLDRLVFSLTVIVAAQLLIATVLKPKETSTEDDELDMVTKHESTPVG